MEDGCVKVSRPLTSTGRVMDVEMKVEHTAGSLLVDDGDEEDDEAESSDS
jgi:hypothetical protein